MIHLPYRYGAINGSRCLRYCPGENRNITPAGAEGLVKEVKDTLVSDHFCMVLCCSTILRLRQSEAVLPPQIAHCLAKWTMRDIGAMTAR